jgi:hypothetical protein
VAPLTVLLATHFLSLRHLPAIGAGAPVRLIRLRSRMGLDFLKKLLFILEFRSIMQPSFVFNLLEQENDRNYVAYKQQITG